MSLEHYILVGKTPILVGLREWGEWFQNHTEERTLAQTRVGDDNVSTVFIGIDMGYGHEVPVLFETMVFPDADIQYRYASYDDAMAGHERVVKMLAFQSAAKTVK